jgi:patatin-like phospholipase/acyl hydrolase
MGGEIPISKFFDLIGGTSAGGLVALGLALRKWKVKDVLSAFVTLSSKAFTLHSTWSVPQLWKEY